MSELINKISVIKNLYKIGGCLESDIINAQLKLNLKFSSDYGLYTLTYGAISFKGTEWTGLGSRVQGYLNVVNTTLLMREIDNDFPFNYFVIENFSREEGAVISDSEGKIYLYRLGEINIIHDSLESYLDECLSR